MQELTIKIKIRGQLIENLLCKITKKCLFYYIGNKHPVVQYAQKTKIFGGLEEK